MESFFALLQKNVLNRRIEIISWIERTDQRRRRQHRLGRLTPIDYETIITPQPATAARPTTVTTTRGSPELCLDGFARRS